MLINFISPVKAARANGSKSRFSPRGEEETDRGLCQFDESGVKTMSGMTINEFKQEVPRILTAFDISMKAQTYVESYGRSVQVTNRNSRVAMHSLRVRTDSFLLYADYSIRNNGWIFEMLSGLTEINFVCNWRTDKPQICAEGDCSQFALIMARAMFRLDLDIALFETHFDLNISAHEKLEWQLEFARRMREDARENGA